MSNKNAMDMSDAEYEKFKAEQLKRVPRTQKTFEFTKSVMEMSKQEFEAAKQCISSRVIPFGFEYLCKEIVREGDV